MKKQDRLSLRSATMLSGWGTMNRKLMMCVASFVLISGCTHVPRAQQEMAYQTTGVVATSLATPIAAREFIGPDTSLRALPTVTVVLKQNGGDLNQDACDAFKSITTIQKALSSSQLTPNIILWKWLLTGPLTDQESCPEMVSKYDYSRAELWFEEIANSDSSGKKPDISGSGPYLVEEIPDRNGVHYIVIDLAKSKGIDADFSKVTQGLKDMTNAQSSVINGNTTPEAASTTSTWTSKLKNLWDGFVKYFCGGTQSTVGKLVLAALNYVPNASEAVTVINTIDKAICPNGGSDTNCTKNNSGQASDKS